jgi:hypothetical protein
MLAPALASARIPASAVSSPELMRKLPATARAPVVAAYATSLQHVFLFAVPEGSDNEHQLANVVGQILRRDNRSSLAGIMASSRTTLDLATAWGLIGVFVREHAYRRPVREADFETVIGVPPGVLRPFFQEIATAGYLTRDLGVLVLTERGEAEVGTLVAAWKAWLMGELRGWLEAHEVNSGQRQQVEEAIGRITLRLVREADVEARRAGLPRATAAAAQ